MAAKIIIFTYRRLILTYLDLAVPTATSPSSALRAPEVGSLYAKKVEYTLCTVGL